MKITFVLPGPGMNPMGGYKVVYEYANSLVARGHDVSVVHPAISRIDTPFYIKLKRWIRYIQRGIDRSHLPSSWFELKPRVKVLWVLNLNEKHIPDADIIVATAWSTSEWVADYCASKGKKYYLIQHYETWDGPEERVKNTWTLPLIKIVIARWLEDIAIQLGEKCFYIPNGLDHTQFGIDTPINDRNRKVVMMLYHEADWKGSADGIKALSLVREAYPDLKVILFGVYNSSNLPSWVEYYRMPNQHVLRTLYNRSSIFISPSWGEGWPLPPAESMMCGCALIATNIGGHREYAKHNKTAFLVEPKCPELLSNAIISLIENQE